VGASYAALAMTDERGSHTLQRASATPAEAGAGPAVVVTRNGKQATLGDIHTGDKVHVTNNPDGSTRQTDATSTGGGRWAVTQAARRRP